MATDEFGNEIPTTSTSGVMDSVSQLGQDAAAQAGVSYNQIVTDTENQEMPDWASYDAEGVGQSVEENVNFKDSSSYLDDAKTTVSGQLNTLLAEDNPYIQQNRQLAEERAAAKGLKNTTMSVMAGQEAAISSALPIAQQDAQTYAQFASKQQEAEYGQEAIQGEAIVSGKMLQQKAEIERQQENINNIFQTKLQEASAKDQIWLADVQGQWNEQVTNLNNESKEYMQSKDLSYQDKALLEDRNSDLMNNLQVTVEELMTTSEILEAGGTALNNAISENVEMTRSLMKLNASSAGMDQDYLDLIDFYLEAYDTEDLIVEDPTEEETDV